MKLNQQLNFPAFPKFDRLSKDHPWWCSVLIVACPAALCLAASGAYLMFVIHKYLP
jgi:hypothetical protein